MSPKDLLYKNRANRKSIRLKGYDYSQNGAYFITICCEDYLCRFGNVDNHEMILNEYGQIAHNEWKHLSVRYSMFDFDVFQIMPNHLHGIIVINDDDLGRTGVNPAPTKLGDIVGAYKSIVANECLEIYKKKGQRMGKLWQRGYYDHIIRNDQSYQKILEYIINNPNKWESDRFFIC